MPGNREFYQNHTSERMFGLGEILYDGTGVSRKFESRIGRRRSKDACESIGSKEPKVVPRRRGGSVSISPRAHASGLRTCRDLAI